MSNFDQTFQYHSNYAGDLLLGFIGICIWVGIAYWIYKVATGKD